MSNIDDNLCRLEIPSDLFFELPIPIIVTDLDGTIRFHSKSAEDYFREIGFEVPKSGSSIFKIQDIISKVEIKNVEVSKIDQRRRIKVSDEGFRMVRCKVGISNLSNNESPSSLFFTFENVTEIPQSENELKKAVLARDTLLSIIGHDLRAPIFQLNGLLFLLQEEGLDSDSGRVARQAKDLEERIFYLTNILDNLLSWTNKQKQGLQSVIKKKDLVETFQLNSGLLKPLAKVKEIKLIEEYPESCECETDHEAVALILRNFLGNAIKFSEKNSSIHLIVEEKANGYLASVQDRGVGIDDDTLKTILDPKQYFTRPGTSGEQGTGLGLKLSFELADMIGAKISIQSKKGEGTLATVEIPK